MRNETWDVDLTNHIKSLEKTPFKWGSQDCVMFAVGCAKVITGVNHAEKHSYSTKEQAQDIINSAGGLRSLITANVGPEISPKLARRGDWVLVKQDDTEALSVCLGAMVIAAGNEGLVMQSMKNAITAWRID